MAKRRRDASDSSSSESDGSEDSRDSDNAPAAKKPKPKLNRSSASQIRSRLRDKVANGIENLPQGDVVLYINVPGTQQGKVQVVHSRMPPQQVLGALKGIRKQLPHREKRLDPHIDRLKRAVDLMEGERQAGASCLAF